MLMEQTFFGLIKRARSLIRTWSFSKWRISRGEYRISLLLLSVTAGFVSTVFQWVALLITNVLPSYWNLYLYIALVASIIPAIIVTIFQVKIIIKRSHDLGKSGRYTYLPMIIALICGIILFKIVFSYDVDTMETQFKSNIVVNAILILIGIVAAIWSIARWIVVGFYKWNTGDNTYGSDPLLTQDPSNRIYRWVGIVLVILNMIISSFNGWLQYTNDENAKIDVWGYVNDTEESGEIFAPSAEYVSGDANTNVNVNTNTDTNLGTTNTNSGATTWLN